MKTTSLKVRIHDMIENASEEELKDWEKLFQQVQLRNEKRDIGIIEEILIRQESLLQKLA